MKKNFRFKIMLFCGILLLLFAGCNKQPDQKNETMQKTENTSELETEPQSFAFKGKSMEQMEKTDQIKIIAEIRSLMGEEAIPLNQDQINTLTEKINTLHLKEYDYNPSNASVDAVAAGGGILIEFYYGQEKITFNFTSANLIVRKEQGKETRYFKDDSTNYREFEEMITGLLL